MVAPQELYISKRESLLTDFINKYQKNFPLCSRPYLQVAQEMGISQDELFQVISYGLETGRLSRVGAVLKPNSLGVSSLVAMAVPAEKIQEVVSYLNKIPDVNHNYLRENTLNIWFVVTCFSEDRLQELLKDVEDKTGCLPLDCRLVKEFRIDLGFAIEMRDVKNDRS